MKKSSSYILTLLVYIGIVGMALYFRSCGMNWDQNQHLNPDERFLTMVATDIHWPPTLREYFQTDTSLLNPNNVGHTFFVYGTWPVYLVKAMAGLLGYDNYDGLTMVGRYCSLAFDMMTLYFVYTITRQLAKKRAAGLIAAGMYGTCAFPIQASHYFTVDPYVTTFLLATLYLLIHPCTKKRAVAVGLTAGLAVGAKISALIILPIIGLWIFSDFVKNKKYIQTFIYGLLFLCIFFVTVRISFPYLFSSASFFSLSLNPKMLQGWKELQSYNSPNTWYPPGIQWIATKPYLFPLGNLLFVGFGLPFIVVFLAFLPTLVNRWKRELWIPLIFFICVFGYQGMQFSKNMRYFYPLYPVVAVFTGYAAGILWDERKKLRVLVSLGLLTLLVWPIMVTSIYRKPTTRVTASEWIYINIPPARSIGIETWDDGLPLPLDRQASYTTVELSLYDRDTEEKWIEMQQKLNSIDYIILSSNRLYGSITSVPEKYPQTTAYYQKLLQGELGFTKVAEFTSRPALPFFVPLCIQLPFFSYGTVAKPSCTTNEIQIIDDYVDESWTVYDHPKVIILKKTRAYTPTQLLFL